MAISEATKQVVAAHKAVLKSRWDALQQRRQEHMDAAVLIKAQMDATKAQSDALTADIPAPTPGPEIIGD